MHQNSSPSLTIWIFGRGASIDCGLVWEESTEWQAKNRQERIENIKKNLTSRMGQILIGENSYSRLLSLLESNTVPSQKNCFVTTNWDYLLQREIQHKNYKISPPWLIGSHVFHLNGSIEELGDNQHRTPIALPDDLQRQGQDRLEFKSAMAEAIWTTHFVIVGLSFNYIIDQKLMKILGFHQDTTPAGEGKYLLVNNCVESLTRGEKIIRRNLPRADIEKIPFDLTTWIEKRCPGLLS